MKIKGYFSESITYEEEIEISEEEFNKAVGDYMEETNYDIHDILNDSMLVMEALLEYEFLTYNKKNARPIDGDIEYLDIVIED